MSAAPTPISARLRRGLRDAMPRGHAWWFVLGACGLGLLLFVGVWLARAPAPVNEGGDALADLPGERAPAALPAPLPAAGRSDRGFEQASAQDQGAPVRIDAHVPRAAPPTPAAPVAAPPEAQNTTAATNDLPVSVPRPVSAPPPDYPRASIRRGERGEVVVLVKVGANGRVTDVELVSSSQHRRLDRAAMSAARRWRFEPALRDGQPVPGEIRVPFAFTPEGG